MKRYKLFATIIVSILLVLLALPSVPVFAQDTPRVDSDDKVVVIDPGKELYAKWGGYEIYFDDVTREYQFVETDIEFGETRQIPPSFKPTKESIVKQFNDIGINQDDVHLSRDYSADHPSYLEYKDANSDTYVSLLQQLPRVTPDGAEVDSSWVIINGQYIAGNNYFYATVNGSQVTLTARVDQPNGIKASDTVVWSPQLYIGKERLLYHNISIIDDPSNANYLQNVIEYDYGKVKRQIRIIEGRIKEQWVVAQNPLEDISIRHNAVGDFDLVLGYAWDIDGNKINVNVIDNDIELVTPDDLTRAVYPISIGASMSFNPDASPETNTVDGYAGRNAGNNSAWVDVRDGAGNVSNDAGSIIIGASIGFGQNANTWWDMYRGIFLFNTAPLDDGITITSATIDLYGSSKLTDFALTPTINIYPSTPASDTAVANADYAQVGTVAQATAITYAVFSVVGYNTFTLNAAGEASIDLTGITKFGTREATYDAPDNEPAHGAGGGTWMGMRYFSSDKGAGFEPELTVTYTPALPTVTSGAATLVEETTATLEGNITATGGENNTMRGFVYDTSTHADPGNVAVGASGYPSNWTEAGVFGVGAYDSGANVSGLTRGELYYYRAVAQNSTGYDYSNTEQSFLTKPDEPTALTATSTGDGDITVAWTTGLGFDQTRVRRKAGSYPINETDGVLAYTAGGNSFVDSGLTGGVTYYYRAWSWCSEGALEQYSDTYAQDNAMALGTPTVGTSATDNVTVAHSLTLNGAITGLGGYANVTDRGFVWDLASQGDPGAVAPAVSGYASNWTENGVFSAGAFFRNETGWAGSTTFYVRACAQNTMGWDYGSEISFSTFDLAIHYQPITIISGTTLPDREGNQDGVITWGTNPAGLTMLLGSMESEFQPAPSGEMDEGTIDILPPTDSSDWFIDPDVAGTLSTNPMRPLVTILSNTTTISEMQAWRLLAIAFILVVTVGTAIAVKSHLLIAGIASGTAIFLVVNLTIFPMWALVFAIGAVVSGVIAERSPSV